MDALHRITRLAVVAFVPLIVVAMVLYPGGTAWDPSAPGHDVLHNTLCDLARSTAQSGSPNPIGSLLAKSAMTILALGLAAFWITMPLGFGDRRATAASVRAMGLSSAAAIPFVAFLSSDRFGDLHGVCVMVAAFPGILAAVVSAFALVAARAARRVTLPALATVATAATGFAAFLPSWRAAATGSVAIPVFERLSTVCLLVWMLSVPRRTVVV